MNYSWFVRKRRFAKYYMKKFKNYKVNQKTISNVRQYLVLKKTFTREKILKLLNFVSKK